MMDYLQKVREFHEKYRLPVRTVPTVNVTADEQKLRKNLHTEEVRELNTAIDHEDLVAIADGIADSLYVIFGTALTYGLTNVVDAVFTEVHRSNMSKAGKDAGGKVSKGRDYSPPSLAKILSSKQYNRPLDELTGMILSAEQLRILRRDGNDG